MRSYRGQRRGVVRGALQRSGGPVARPDRHVAFTTERGVWQARNTAADGQNSRKVVLEFLEERPRHTQAEVDALLARAVYSTDVGTALLMENERCRI